MCLFGELTIDAEESPVLSDWFTKMDEMAKKGSLSGNEQLDEIIEKLVPPQTAPPTVSANNSLASMQSGSRLGAV